MSEKRGNIETWLKTAASQPGPGIDRKEEDEGWAGLSAMLDGDDASPGITGGSGLPLRRRWLAVTAAALILSLLLLISPRRLKDISRPPSGKAYTTVTHGQSNNTVRRNAGGGIVHQAPARPSGKPVPGTEPLTAAAARPDRMPAQQPARYTVEKPLWEQEAARPLQKEPDNITVANGLSLRTIPLPGAWAGNNGLVLPGAGQYRWPVPSLPGAAARYARWAIQAGIVAANDEGLGGRVSFMYRLPVRRHFYLQPYIGAGYTGNYDKTLQHLNAVTVQSGTSGLYRSDFMWTSYKVKSVLAADAGFRAGYTLRQFSFAAGMRYHYILQSKGDTTSFRKSVSGQAGTGYHQTFSKADAPGRHSFYGEVEAAYQWRSGLQTGVSFQLLLHKSALPPSWQTEVSDPGSGSSWWTTIPGAAPPAAGDRLQDKGRLEIYLRMPLRKK
jgi:hypothetical protein